MCVKGLTDLIHDIFERVWAINGKADENQVGLGV